ncbi:hypothetical protein H072_8847 [Dactylellina haptotyla CBS 200.50]|uniref:Protein SQS1 n=1 Tax=Dactylellina haptotyla (strain CBS 200.50) TaxID=1284197 RepID=S8A3X8_DACHA|nr:hypothetical protein H072_8847 [Dactylellina haptotyla CBS 200.50]
MPRRKHSRASPKQKSTRWHPTHQIQYPATSSSSSPAISRRSKRLLLLGDDFALEPYGYGSPGPSPGKRIALRIPYKETSFASYFRRRGFTLLQEARNTEDHASRRNDDRKLRQIGIAFVRPQDAPTIPEIEPNIGHILQEPAIGINPETIQVDSETMEPLSLTPSVSQYAQPSDKPSSDGGDNDEVVFIPRNRRRQPDELTNALPKAINPGSTSHNYIETVEPQPPFEPRHQKEQPNSEDELLADYIQNLRENGNDGFSFQSFPRRPLGNYQSDIDASHDEQDKTQPELEPLDNGFTSESSESDFDNANSNVDINVAAVIGKRRGPVGIEYQFKPAGSSSADTIWLEGTDMTREIQHLIDHFEASLDDIGGQSEVMNGNQGYTLNQGLLDYGKPVNLPQTQNVDLGRHNSDYKLDGNGSDEDEDYDAEDLLSMMMGKPNKQGKFPRASNLADAYDNFDIMDRGRTSLTTPSKHKSRNNRLNKISDAFANMSMEEDEEETEERDQEIVTELRRYISQDRKRKLLRKQEKNALRGALALERCSANKSASMDVKEFEDGMLLGQTYVAIKRFLMSGITERLSLPPMAKTDRLQVHVVAHKFFMTSKSQGKGSNRFPVLYKTTRSRLFEGDEEAIDRILRATGNVNSRGKLGNVRGRGGRQSVAGSGGSGIKTMHKDGMIVGTGAAEIGQGNKGYEMLAKMGWKTGTGLGSNRSGILDPVQAIVKNSRSGLG